MLFTTENNITLELTLHNNTELFAALAELKIVKPKVPQFYLKARDIWIDNPDHPKYKEALQVYEVEKMLRSLDVALLLSIQESKEIINVERKKLKYRTKTDNEVWLDYLKNTLSDVDIYNVINNCFLTENMVYDIFNMLVMSIYRGGVEIIDARLKNALNSQIKLDQIVVGSQQLVHPLDEYTACVESNISWTDWQTMPLNEKANIVALYRIKRIVENHANDEQIIESERRSKNS